MPSLAGILTPISRAKVRSFALELAVVLGFAAIAVVMTWPLLSHARTHTVDVGVDDTLLYTRYSRCFRDWLLGRSPGWLDFDMYFPSLYAGATDDAAIGIAVQALPISLFVDDWLFTVNLVTYASFVMCAHATYLLTREITRSRGAGIVAGFAFAFCFYRLRQLEHPHVLQMQWLPYALYFLHRLAAAPTRKNAILFAVFLFFAFTASFNVAIYSMLVFPPVTAWLFFTAKEDKLRFAGWVALACAVVGVLLLPVYRPFFVLRDAGAPLRQAWELKMFSSRLESFYAAPKFAGHYRELSKNMSDECATFLGWVVLVLASVGVFGLEPSGRAPIVKPRRAWLLLPFGVARACALTAALVVFACVATFDPWARELAIAGVLAAIVLGLVRRWLHPAKGPVSPAPVYVGVALLYAAFCFGMEVRSHNVELGKGIWSELRGFPGFEQVRTPSRFFFVSSMCAAVCAGIGANVVALAFPGKRMRFLCYVLAAAAVLWDLRPDPIPLRAMPTVATAPEVYRALAAAPKPGAVLELPVEWSTRERIPVYYANIHGRPEVNGMSGWATYWFDVFQDGYWEQKSKAGTEPMARAALVAENIAGLRYVVVRRGWGVTARTNDVYVQGIAAIGGKKIATYGDDDLYELPDPPPSRPLRKGDLRMDLEKIELREGSTRDAVGVFNLVNLTGDAIYDGQKPRHFRVKATAAGATVGEGNLYLLPPLFAAHQDYEVAFRFKLAPRPRPDWTDVTVVDDDGEVWSTTSTKLP